MLSSPGGYLRSLNCVHEFAYGNDSLRRPQAILRSHFLWAPWQFLLGPTAELHIRTKEPQKSSSLWSQTHIYRALKCAFETKEPSTTHVFGLDMTGAQELTPPHAHRAPIRSQKTPSLPKKNRMKGSCAA
ncbi:Hypothetical protein [Corynebacterium glutamicum ATCC 13032]|uniref:Uncharacterized protein n=1 Tax=Corynebacterium glutamicum (strain ATCC 13032 / DSM 20300 / JCM 1318 / BCRC 11384 / CCUG 27702 / LMG 3730 / NBRC 12168 / NCIMB 10025 / NRRL B-2784 / 534) TaxID=196627 RepID=Q8NRR1_CORGL|nr:Hypothetical protein [Corynebacterium glutamicum ATCC 13032]